MTIEVCVDSVQSALLAQQAGADRLELNCALPLDGLTPPAGLVQRVRESVSIPILAMVRVRSGDFVYSTDEWETMKREIQSLLEMGVDGLAFGALSASGDVDESICHEFCQIARNCRPDCQLVFHKAFDVTSDWKQALETIIDLGFTRIMSSGQAVTAVEGIPVLADLVADADRRIEILPAGGVRAENAAKIAKQTGCDQLHASFRSSRGSMPPTEQTEFLTQIRDAKQAFLPKNTAS